MKSKEEDFIEMVLSCADENLPIDNSLLLRMITYKIDDVNDKLDCVQEQLQDIENKINVLYKLLIK
jgi:hypothetical protein